MPGVVEVGATCCVPTAVRLELAVQHRRPRASSAAIHRRQRLCTCATPGLFRHVSHSSCCAAAISATPIPVGAPGAVIVNQAFASRFWPNGDDALGARILDRQRASIEHPCGWSPSARSSASSATFATVRDRRRARRRRCTSHRRSCPTCSMCFFLGSIPLMWGVAHGLAASEPCRVRFEAELRQSDGRARRRASRTMAESCRSRLRAKRLQHAADEHLRRRRRSCSPRSASTGSWRTPCSSGRRSSAFALALGPGGPQADQAHRAAPGRACSSVSGVAVGIAAAFFLSTLLGFVALRRRAARRASSSSVSRRCLRRSAFAAVVVAARRAGRIDPLDALRYE